MVLPEPYFSVEIQVVRLGSFQNLYLSFAIVEITHGVTANRDDIIFLLWTQRNKLNVSQFVCLMKRLIQNRPVTNQDFSWFQDFLLQIYLCLIIFLKKREVATKERKK